MTFDTVFPWHVRTLTGVSLTDIFFAGVAPTTTTTTTFIASLLATLQVRPGEGFTALISAVLDLLKRMVIVASRHAFPVLASWCGSLWWSSTGIETTQHLTFEILRTGRQLIHMATHAALVAGLFACPDGLVPLCMGYLLLGEGSITSSGILATISRTHLLQVSGVLHALSLAYGRDGFFA